MDHTPTPPILAVIVIWMVLLGMWIEQHRRGGSYDLEAERDQHARDSAGLLSDVEKLVVENARLRAQVGAQRADRPYVPQSPRAAERLQLVAGGRS